VNEFPDKVKCPRCGDQIMKSYPDEVKMRAAVLKWNAAGLFAVCKGCNEEVQISFDLLKSVQTRFVYEVKKG
jgi:hypothetical protein